MSMTTIQPGFQLATFNGRQGLVQNGLPFGMTGHRERVVKVESNELGYPRRVEMG